MIQCDMMCPDGQTMDPRYACNCVDTEELMKELYPEDVTAEKIEMANDAAWKNFRESSQSEEWPMCNPTPGCLEGTIFNGLSCECYQDPALVRCAAPCDEDMYRDPRSPCECFDEYELYSLFPSWADLDDIKKSLGIEDDKSW